MAYSTHAFKGCHDDREYGAALRLQNILSTRGDAGIAVFVTRTFGGNLLGPKRFLHMENAVHAALKDLTNMQSSSRGGKSPSPVAQHD